MPPTVSRDVVKRLNCTRQASGGALWKPGSEAYVCNSHYKGFQGPSRAKPNVLPTLFKRPQRQHLSLQEAKRERRLLERTELPSTFSDTSVGDHESEECDTRLATLESNFLRLQQEFLQTKVTLEKHVEALKAEVLLLRTRPQRLDVILLSKSQMEMYTGLNPKAFQLLLHWLQPILPCRSKLDTSLHALEEDDETISSTPTPYDSRYLDNSQKLLLVLMRIRQGLAQEDLAFRFDVDQSSVSRILNRWIPLLAFHLRGLIIWPSTTIGPFIQRPSNLSTQKSSYSEYKSHTTVKFLVSIDPFTGVFNFVSTGFSGNSSDRFVVENSGFLDVLRPGQRILADRGFTARDLIAQKSAFLTIPSFLRGASKLTGQQAMETRTVASVRIRVENAIKRLKDFHLLSTILPNRMNKRILDDIFVIASALCNLQPPLIT